MEKISSNFQQLLFTKRRILVLACHKFILLVYTDE